ncbi:MAG: sigma factor-like helix-turn-helix DNA-binding protein, partial [Butyricicoccus sp.]
ELSRTDKEILYLRYQLNLNCVDIAEYLHISHEASRARLSRAKQHYAHLLAKERLM